MELVVDGRRQAGSRRESSHVGQILGLTDVTGGAKELKNTLTTYFHPF